MDIKIELDSPIKFSKIALIDFTLSIELVYILKNFEQLAEPAEKFFTHRSLEITTLFVSGQSSWLKHINLYSDFPQTI